MHERVNRAPETKRAGALLHVRHQPGAEPGLTAARQHRDRLDDGGIDRLAALLLRNIRQAKTVTDRLAVGLGQTHQAGYQQRFDLPILGHEFLARNRRIEIVVPERHDRQVVQPVKLILEIIRSQRTQRDALRAEALAGAPDAPVFDRQILVDRGIVTRQHLKTGVPEVLRVFGRVFGLQKNGGA